MALIDNTLFLTNLRLDFKPLSVFEKNGVRHTPFLQLAFYFDF